MSDAEIDLDAHDSPVEDSLELGIPHPDQTHDLSANQLLKFCMLWRMEVLCRMNRDRSAEFQQDRDKLLGLYDVPSSMLRLMFQMGLGGPSSSASFLSEEQFRYLTEHLERACDDRRIGSGHIFDFGNYVDADLKAATRELDRLERQLRRELSQEPSAPPAEAQLGAVDRSKMLVYTSSGWIEVSRSKLLDAIEALTRNKGAWLVSWKCFGTDVHTNTRMDKELKRAPVAIARHIEPSSHGYRWVDSPTTRTKRRKKRTARRTAKRKKRRKTKRAS